MRIILILFFTMVSTLASNAAPKVVTSIKPIHSLTAGIMEGIGEPELLLNSNASPHDFSLKPSQAKSLQDADLIVWIGENLEGFLEKPLSNLSSKTSTIELNQIQGLTLHEYRELDEHDGEHDHSHSHNHSHDHDAHNHGEHSNDPHLWLDISNAKKITAAITQKLSEIDAENKTAYENNAKQMDVKLSELQASLASTLENAKSKNYIVFHDAYQYFEKTFGLKAPTALTINPEAALGAARIKQVQAVIAEKDIKCLFSEPQFPVKIMEVLAENTNAKIAILDPLGSDLEDGKDLYFGMMQGLAGNFTQCLQN